MSLTEFAKIFAYLLHREFRLIVYIYISLKTVCWSESITCNLASFICKPWRILYKGCSLHWNFSIFNTATFAAASHYKYIISQFYRKQHLKN